MKSKNGNILYGARISEKVEFDVIQLKDMDTKETTDVGVRFLEEVEDGEFSELDIISINKDNTVAFTWAQEKAKAFKEKGLGFFWRGRECQYNDSRLLLTLLKEN